MASFFPDTVYLNVFVCRRETLSTAKVADDNLMQKKQCSPHCTHDTVVFLAHETPHFIGPKPFARTVCFEPRLLVLGSHEGENVSYASTRRGRFEAASDWHVVWDAVVSH